MEYTREDCEKAIDDCKSVIEINTSLLKKWQERLERIKPELEEGVWYENDSNCLFCFNGKYDKGGNPCGYGYGYSDGIWIEEDKEGWSADGLKKAPEEKVIEAHKKEAEKRGLFEDTKLKAHANLYGTSFINNNEYTVTKAVDGMYNNHGKIYHKGKWAIPLKESKSDLLESIERIADHLEELTNELIELKNRLKDNE